MKAHGHWKKGGGRKFVEQQVVICMYLSTKGVGWLWLDAAGCLVGCYYFPILARQRVAERIEASGTPLGLPDAAFDAPSMVQENIWEIPEGKKGEIC